MKKDPNNGMVKLLPGILATALGAVTLSAADAPKPHQLPDDPGAAVIVVDRKGGFAPARDNPQLLILSDGTASVPSNDPRKRLEWKMTEKQLQSLLRDLVDKLKIFDLKSSELPRANFAVDAVEMIIKIEADGRKHEVKAPSFARKTKFKDNHDRFLSVLRRLQQVQATVTLGGMEVVGSYLKAVNAELAKSFPKEKPFTAADLKFGRRLANGDTAASFKRDGLSGGLLHRKGQAGPEVTVRRR